MKEREDVGEARGEKPKTKGGLLRNAGNPVQLLVWFACAVVVVILTSALQIVLFEVGLEGGYAFLTSVGLGLVSVFVLRRLLFGETPAPVVGVGSEEDG